MQITRRATLAGLAALPFAAQAQDNKPIRLLVGFPAGGGTDAIARLLAEALQASLGTTVIVENKAGAGGQIAAQALKVAAPDGTSFFVSHDHTISILPLVLKNPGFDPARDFVPVAGFATFANALALSGGTPATSLPEYVAWVKKQGGQGSVGVPAPASVPEFLVRLLGEHNGLNLLSVPYRGSAPMMADMLGNQIAAGIGSVPDLIANHQQKKLRIVAVMGQQRQGLLPEVPTFAELGIAGFEDLPYYGVFAPAGTPRAALERFSNALAGVIAQADMKARLTELGLSVGMMSSAQLATRERAYSAAWARIIKAGGFQPQ
ncbi:Bug family tripartite tricarboxylate transporter substrate binding protein [Pelomonas aquatica]|jgi:tripartite-type tricarboxylate transporter receptor subunit TctC|uniref:Twin-arginine translocation pathway signal n=1 Tax=Pelomonas aquatica TaxID=431058 RepID=A0A9X4LDK1_9BURK|nr:Bug family tripartite tricarboxylate transporter substrate binding protein [Pelomonas aquatica]MCY4754931.1 Bug family tripartite tricarboxylate transporter substrate binding protein [Pelomonas aquatica]MDG0861051.1 Twin-arginine translocation pathway signal [Pelomonas aquatica]